MSAGRESPFASDVQDLLTSVAEPETPEERDAAWNEIARRDALLTKYHIQFGRLPDYSNWGRIS